MKKILSLLVMMLMTVSLTACGSEEISSKTCTIESDGLQQTFKLTATNNTVDKIELTMVYDAETLGVDSLSELDDSQKELIESNMLDTLGLESATNEGLELTIDFDDVMTVVLKVDLKKADSELLEKVGLDFTDATEEDMSLDVAVEEMESSGATCK